MDSNRQRSKRIEEKAAVDKKFLLLHLCKGNESTSDRVKGKLPSI